MGRHTSQQICSGTFVTGGQSGLSHVKRILPFSFFVIWAYKGVDFSQIIKMIGDCDSVTAHTAGILIEHGVDESTFPDADLDAFVATLSPEIASVTSFLYIFKCFPCIHGTFFLLGRTGVSKRFSK